MLISVIIPVYNAEKSIEKALDSIKNQTWKGQFEILSVNDGSTDKSREIIENYQLKNPEMNIKLINQENGGVSKARNAALQIASGEYIALLDADDEWLPRKTEVQLEYLQSNNIQIDFLAAQRTNHTILFPYRINRDSLAVITFAKLMLRNEAQPSTVIFKRKILTNTGFFDPEQQYAEDLNYWLRISLTNKMYILGEKLVMAGGEKRSFGFSGLSANLSAMEQGFQKNLKEMYNLRTISYPGYLFYRIFYSAKYVLRIIRNKYSKMEGR